MQSFPVCGVDGCEREGSYCGMCQTHYKRFKRAGDASVGSTLRRKSPRPLCKVEDCGCEVHAGGYCRRHYWRVTRHGDPLKGRNTQHNGKCSVEGCDREYEASGYCRAHYRRFYCYVDPLGSASPRPLPNGYVNDDGYKMVPAAKYPGFIWT